LSRPAPNGSCPRPARRGVALTELDPRGLRPVGPRALARHRALRAPASGPPRRRGAQRRAILIRRRLRTRHGPDREGAAGASEKPCSGQCPPLGWFPGEFR
jgi:hypothetical protein